MSVVVVLGRGQESRVICTSLGDRYTQTEQLVQ